MTRHDKRLIDDPHLDRLGPMPRQALAALSDLGLTTSELARYFSVDPSTIEAFSSREGRRAATGRGMRRLEAKNA